MYLEEIQKEMNFLESNADIQVKAFRLSNIGSIIFRQFEDLEIQSITPTLQRKVEGLKKQTQEIENKIAENGEILSQKIRLEEKYAELLPILQTIEELKEKQNVIAIGYEALVADYNAHIDKINQTKADLDIIKDKYDDVISVFKAHNLENETIYGALRNREGVLHYVELLSKDISEKLKQYDTYIKEIVEKRDQLPIYQLPETIRYQR
jgi:uncharacterized protein YoxC